MRDAPEATKVMTSRRTSADIANIGGQVVSPDEIERYREDTSLTPDDAAGPRRSGPHRVLSAGAHDRNARS